MSNQGKVRMKEISQYVGQRADYIQGGGGNTSYKFDDKIMAIKASGYTLKEVQEESGYVTVDHSEIKDRYAELLNKEDIDVEKETLAINLDCVKLLDGMENRRPSVEVGFHSYLQRTVIHSHSVYSNLLCCAEEGREYAEKIFGGSEFGYIYIPFIHPGCTLSMHIKEKAEAFKAMHGKMPDLVFMESHGMIASNDDYKTAIEIHEKANKLIIDYFGAVEFPEPCVKKTDEGYVSNTDFIKTFIKDFHADEVFFDENSLYPDQIVYLYGNLGKTILVDADQGTITYKTNQKQAETLEETILGVVYVIAEIHRLGLTLKLLCDEGVDFIKNWESEKYRASIVSE